MNNRQHNGELARWERFMGSSSRYGGVPSTASLTNNSRAPTQPTLCLNSRELFSVVTPGDVRGLFQESCCSQVLPVLFMSPAFVVSHLHRPKFFLFLESWGQTTDRTTGSEPLHRGWIGTSFEPRSTSTNGTLEYAVIFVSDA